jgi:hypothetical protein
MANLEDVHFTNILNDGEISMKQFKKIMIYALLFLLLGPAITLAANEPRLYLTVSQSAPEVNEEITVDVLVEDVTSVYGTEVRLLFDPELLEAVDINHGDFLSPDPDNEAFVLQKVADNEIGTVDYAVALLNPAPPVDGSGLLLQVTFRAKSAGPARVDFENGLFGTQTGEEIVATTEGIELNISGVATDQAEQTENGPITQSNLSIYILVGVVLVLLIGLFIVVMGVAFWLSRRNKPQAARHY